MVTGPSPADSTSMAAPKRPLATGTPDPARALATASTRGAASSGGAAAT
jgi:hypothetical protein